MWLEGLSFFDSLYLTIITLATIGYGDMAPKTPEGRFFVMGLVVFGLATFTIALQSILSVLSSPALREIRQNRQMLRIISSMSNHYVLCGSGELVDKIISYICEIPQM